MSRPAHLLCIALLTIGCGASVTSSPTLATTPVTMPESAERRREVLDELGQRTWQAMAAGEPERLLYQDAELEALLDGAASTRVAARRLALADRLDVEAESLSRPLSSAAYAGICLQGARSETAGGPLGLVSDGWVFDRLLIIGRRQTGRRVAAWIEGVFIYSDAGFAAIDLERVEEPRWEHSDLEIAPCDLSIRNDLPEIAR